MLTFPKKKVKSANACCIAARMCKLLSFGAFEIAPERTYLLNIGYAQPSMHSPNII